MGIPEMDLHLRDHPRTVEVCIWRVAPTPHGFACLSLPDAVHASYQDHLRLLEFVGFSGNKVATSLLGLPSLSPRAGAQLVGCGYRAVGP